MLYVILPAYGYRQLMYQVTILMYNMSLITVLCHDMCSSLN